MDPSKTPQPYRLPTYAPSYAKRYSMNHPNPADSPSAARNPYEKKLHSEAGSPTPSRHHPQDEMDTNNAPNEGEEEEPMYEGDEYEENDQNYEDDENTQEEPHKMEEVTWPPPPPLQPKTPPVAPVLSLVNAQAEQGNAEASMSRVTFEESMPKANRNWTGPVDTPVYNPYAFYGQQPKKVKTAANPNDPNIVVQDDTQKLAEEAKKCTKEIIDDILHVYAPDFIQDDKDLGNVRLLDNWKRKGHHCVPPKQTLKQFAARTDSAELLANVASTCPTWVYVADVIHFHKGLTTLEKTKVYNITADDYLPSALPKTTKPCNAILVRCKSEEAERRITALVSIDIHNVMDNINNVIALVLTHFRSYMAWEKWTDTERHPVYLALAKIPDGPPEGRMTTAQMICAPLHRTGNPQNWKLAFIPRLDHIMLLKIPKVTGQWAKGTVNMMLSDFCQSCTSYSHTLQYCAWWTVPGVLTCIKRPQGFQELEWMVVEAVTPQSPPCVTSKMVIEILSTREGTPADPTPAEAK
ncbi:hypothetical protein FRB99_009036 [Tulasnella sp. 403]|nr:hypothetical protein FRB99_009036 [Tulasnella sp. 403]